VADHTRPHRPIDTIDTVDNKEEIDMSRVRGC